VGVSVGSAPVVVSVPMPAGVCVSLTPGAVVFRRATQGVRVYFSVSLPPDPRGGGGIFFSHNKRAPAPKTDALMLKGVLLMKMRR